MGLGTEIKKADRVEQPVQGQADLARAGLGGGQNEGSFPSTPGVANKPVIVEGRVMDDINTTIGRALEALALDPTREVLLRHGHGEVILPAGLNRASDDWDARAVEALWSRGRRGDEAARYETIAPFVRAYHDSDHVYAALIDGVKTREHADKIIGTTDILLDPSNADLATRMSLDERCLEWAEARRCAKSYLAHL